MKVSEFKIDGIAKDLFTKRVLVLSLFLLLATFSAPSQTELSIKENIFQSSKNLHQWGTISSFNGLPSERVNAISQTPDGFIWFATDNGLAKFDGKRVQTNLSSDLSSVKVLSLKLASDGSLWIATEKGAFFYKDNFFQPIPETSDYTINSIFVDEDLVYLTSSKGSVFICETKAGLITTQKILETSLPIKNVVRIEDKIFVGTYNAGLLEIVGGKAEHFITRPRRFFINALQKDSTNKVWFGVNSSDGNSGLFVTEKLPNLKVIGGNLGTVNSIAFGKDKRVWIGTEQRGAFLFDGQEFRKRFTFENTSGGLRSNKINSIHVDREGVVWFGTDKGVNRYDPHSPKNEILSQDVESNFIRTLFRTSQGEVYAGTNRGLYKFNEKSSVWQTETGFETTTIYSLSESSDSSLLVGSPKNLSSKLAGVETTIDVKNVRAIEKFNNEIFYSSFGAGLKKIDSEESEILSESSIVSLHNEDDKTLWIGTSDRGVFLFDGKNSFQKSYLEKLNQTAVWAITGNKTDGVWFATNKGLYLLRNEELRVILHGEDVRDVITEQNTEGKQRVWCATKTGLFSLVFEENFEWMYSKIDIEQGLTSENIFSILNLGNGDFLLGTNQGIVRYKTNEKRPLLTANRILSQRIHQPSELKSGIELSYPQNSLSVDVMAISSRTFPEQFQYSFLLFDSNNELIDKKFSDDSQFLMDKLKPDTYKVKVRAFDKNLLGSVPLVFNLTVERAPFPLIATVLAVLLFIALAALIWAIFSQQKTTQTSKELVTANQELNNARLNLANEAERERHRISRDLHDQTLADLRHLILSSDEVSTEKASEFRTEIEGISDEIRRICEDLSPSVLENIGFAASLEWALGNSVEQVSKEYKITHNFTSSENLEERLNLTRSEQIQIYRVAQEVLSNIVRHSNASEINMNATIDKEDVFIMTVEDDGNAFDPNVAKKGRGLASINARAKLIKSEVEWKTLEDKGMRFILRKV